MKDLLDWITAIGVVLLVYAALRYPLYPPRDASGSRCECDRQE
ncbi:hypothetical protein [Cupriavidus sp. RAF12]